jgi:Predicted permease, DMT superfamily
MAVLSFFWGNNWPIMKVVLTEVPPLHFRTICLLAGGTGMLLVALFSGNSIRIPTGQWSRVVLISLFGIVGWNIFAIYGVLLLPSGRAALLGYTMPLWSVLLSVWLLGEKLTRQRIVALLLGIIGIFVLISNSLAEMLNVPLGVFCMVLAAWSWALGIVLLKRFSVTMPVSALTGWMMLLAGIPLAVLATLLETSPLQMPSFWPAFGVIYNVLIAFMLCNWMWNRIVLMVPVSVSSLSSLATPLVGVLGGVVFLGEPLGWREILATLLILSAVGTLALRHK